MSASRPVRTVTLGVAAALLLFWAAHPRASEESVDRLTKGALALDADPRRGASIFAENCVRCHGEHAGGNAKRAIPALAGQRFAYLVRQLANFSGGERDSAAMHRVLSDARLKEPQTWVDVAAHLNSAPVARVTMTGDGAHVGLGRGIFHEQCASCHLPDARGDDSGFIPSLRNQHYSYLVSQLRQLGAGSRHNVDENLVRFIRSFDDQDIAAVADYLSRLRGPGAVRKQMRSEGVVVD